MNDYNQKYEKYLSITFERWWQDYGSFHNEVFENPKLKDLFQSFAKKVLLDGAEYGYEKGYLDGDENGELKGVKIGANKMRDKIEELARITIQEAQLD